jgi:hypothetical protein
MTPSEVASISRKHYRSAYQYIHAGGRSIIEWLQEAHDLMMSDYQTAIGVLEG